MSAVSPAPVLAVAGSFSIDSILAPDGRPVVGKVGGNALWSSLGALICGLAPRVLAIVGNDYPGHVLDILSNAGLDTRSIKKIDRPHPVRVTFAHPPDGSRIQPVPDHMIRQLPEDVQAAFVDTTSRPDILPLGAPTAKDVPAEWLAEADFWHLPLLPLHRHRELVAHLGGASGYLQSDCPARSDLTDNPFAKLSETLGALDVFLPSTSDFDVIAPSASIPDILQKLTETGARTIVLKAGADGVFVKAGDALWRVPAYPGSPVDPTGGRRHVLRRVPGRHGPDRGPGRSRCPRIGGGVLCRCHGRSAGSRRDYPRADPRACETTTRRGRTARRFRECAHPRACWRGRSFQHHREHIGAAMQKMTIGVIGRSSRPGESLPASVLDTAYQVGRGIAEAGAVLVGGGTGGVMEASCKGAAENGGLTVGFLPYADKSKANPYVNIVFPTGMGTIRNTS